MSWQARRGVVGRAGATIVGDKDNEGVVEKGFPFQGIKGF